MKKILLILLVSLATKAVAQSRNADTDREAIKQQVNTRSQDYFEKRDEEAVKLVLYKYKAAIEKLDVTRTGKLFATDAKIFETGSSEGSYQYYLEHHLAPELKEFKSFTFGNYSIEVQLDGNYAFSTERYTYTIIFLKDNSQVVRNGVTTSVLKKIGGEWKIIISHNSSRK